MPASVTLPALYCGTLLPAGAVLPGSPPRPAATGRAGPRCRSIVELSGPVPWPISAWAACRWCTRTGRRRPSPAPSRGRAAAPGGPPSSSGSSTCSTRQVLFDLFVVVCLT
ncbi:hypothetical protein HBB16_15755 [Pseudonocardia sp. MCCB 268]|nr:hypothetical protein [Pseudonocardia cytotoxica]